MKKILLASTMLVGTAGFAAADVTFSGGAYVGGAYVFGGTANVDFSVNFRAGMMTTTDGGLEVGAFALVLGPTYSMEKDPTDAEFATISNTTSSGGLGTAGTAIIPAAGVYMSGSWGRVDVVYDNNANGTNDAETWDITTTYSNTWGNFGLSAFYVYSGGGASTTNGDLGVQGTYTFGNYSVWAAVERDASDGDGNTIDLKAGASAEISGFTAEVSGKFDIGTGFTWAAAAGYATGPYAISAFISNDAIGAITPDYGAKATYDLGGGVMLEAGYAHSGGVNSPAANIVYGGVSMRF